MHKAGKDGVATTGIYLIGCLLDEDDIDDHADDAGVNEALAFFVSLVPWVLTLGCELQL